MKDESLTWIAKNVDEWPDGSRNVARVPTEFKAEFNPLSRCQYPAFDFIEYAMERKRLGLPVPEAPKTQEEIDIEEVLALFKGDYCEERAKDVIKTLIDDKVLQLHGWT